MRLFIFLELAKTGHPEPKNLWRGLWFQ